MGDNPVLQAMRTVHFAVHGASRSYLDFYLGFGYSIAALQFMLAVLLWQLAALTTAGGRPMRPLIAVIALAILLCGAISFVFIFPLPAVFSAVLFGTLVMAYTTARR
jgi:hypothetical protein